MTEAAGDVSADQLAPEAIRRLEDVLMLAHEDEDGYAPLAECHAAARLLRETLADANGQMGEDAHGAAVGIVDGSHPLGALLELVTGAGQLDDDRWFELQTRLKESDTQVFSDMSHGRKLATAIARGKVRFGQAATVSAMEPMKPEASNGNGDGIANEVDASAPSFDDLLQMLDEDPDESELEVEDPDQEASWIFDEFEEAPPSRETSLIIAARNTPLRSEDPPKSATSHQRPPSSKASRVIRPASSGRLRPASSVLDRDYFQLSLFGADEGRALRVPRRLLRAGWKLSDIILYQYYVARCEDLRKRGFTPCCTDHFREIASTLGLPQRRLRYACLRLERRKKIVIIPKPDRECRIWISDGHVSAGGKRPPSPRAQKGAEVVDAVLSETLHYRVSKSLIAGLQTLMAADA